MVLRSLRLVFRFCCEFLVGDRWQIAAGVCAVLGCGVALAHSGPLPGPLLAIVLGASLMLMVVLLLVHEVWSTRRRHGGDV